MQDFVWPLEEMTVDVGHVENRLLFAVAERQQSYVAHFVNQCNWSKLASTILKDRELAHALRGKTVYSTESRDHAIMLQAICHMERKYLSVQLYDIHHQPARNGLDGKTFFQPLQPHRITTIGG